LTEQQSKDIGFYSRGAAIIDRLDKQDEALTSTRGALANTLPGGNFIKGDSYRQAEQTGRELLAVILRKDTGAAVTDSEMQMYGDIYLPKPGDDKATIDQKRKSRRTALDGIKMGLGPADVILKSKQEQEALKAAKEQPAAVQAPAGAGPSRIQSPAEYQSLPSGAKFIAPDGTVRVKP
jgi:hypothetical protein